MCECECGCVCLCMLKIQMLVVCLEINKTAQMKAIKTTQFCNKCTDGKVNFEIFEFHIHKPVPGIAFEVLFLQTHYPYNTERFKTHIHTHAKVY